MHDPVAIVEQAEVSEQQLIDAATNAIAAEFWTVGWAASEWVKLGKSEQEFADRVGLSQQSVNQKRRVHERFKNLTNRLVNLSFTHFIRALDMREPEEWLEEADANKWSWREMVANHNDHYTPADHEPEPESTPAQNAVHEFFGDSENDETVEASGDIPEPSEIPSSDSATGPEQTTPPASPSIVKSEDGKEDIPEKLKPAHQTGALFQSICRKHIDPLRRALKEYREQPGAEFFDFTKVDRELQTAKDEIVSSRFWRCCPRSDCGPKCDLCDGHGYLPQKRSGYLSKEEKERLGVS